MIRKSNEIYAQRFNTYHEKSLWRLSGKMEQSTPSTNMEKKFFGFSNAICTCILALFMMYKLDHSEFLQYMMLQTWRSSSSVKIVVLGEKKADSMVFLIRDKNHALALKVILRLCRSSLCLFSILSSSNLFISSMLKVKRI